MVFVEVGWGSRAPYSRRLESRVSFRKFSFFVMRTTVRSHQEATSLASMPARAQWLLRVPEMLEHLSDLKTPVIDCSRH